MATHFNVEVSGTDGIQLVPLAGRSRRSVTNASALHWLRLYRCTCKPTVTATDSAGTIDLCISAVNCKCVNVVEYCMIDMVL